MVDLVIRDPIYCVMELFGFSTMILLCFLFMNVFRFLIILRRLVVEGGFASL